MSLLLSIIGNLTGGTIQGEPKPTVAIVESKPSSLEFKATLNGQDVPVTAGQDFKEVLNGTLIVEVPTSQD